MSERNLFDEQSPVIRLRVWALGQMVWGAFLGGVFLAVIAAFAIAVWIVSQLLPEQSKQAPSPYGALEISQPLTEIV